MMNLSNLLPTVAEACKLQELSPTTSDPLVLGVSDAAKAAVIAGIAHDTGRIVLVITPRQPDALALVEELATWLGDSLPVHHFQERDALPYEHIAPEPEALGDRLGTLEAIASGVSAVVVSSGVALAQRTLPPPLQAPVELRTGGQLTPDEFMASLVRFGYSVGPLIEEQGDAARRGGIIDVFPATANTPVRVEFLGSEVETLRQFDPDTQRSGTVIDSLSLGPAREVANVAEAATRLASQLDFGACTPDVQERIEDELARLQNGDAIEHDGFYIPFLTSGILLDHLPDDALVIVDEPAELARAVEEHDAQTDEVRTDLEVKGELPSGLPTSHVPWPELHPVIDALPGRVHLSRWASDMSDAQEEPVAAETDPDIARRLPFAKADAYGGRLRTLASALSESSGRNRTVVVVTQQAERLAEVLAEDGILASLTEDVPAPVQGAIHIVHGSLTHGWRMTASTPPLTLLTDAEVFGFVKQRRRAPTSGSSNRAAFLAELSPGDHVVHVEHGIARFVGMAQRRIDNVEREYLELRYAKGDKLFVPADQVDRLSRYVGPSDQSPGLTRLGSQEWTRAKERVRRAVADLAKELIELYASRQFETGRSFSPDSPWQQELEASFPYVETDDQLAAARAVKADMESDRPMDRLVCGDVGYGKTEVAVRAAFKAVTDGAQVAILVPTTVLAKQHLTTFTERLAGFPMRVDMLSRFRSDKEQRDIAAGLAAGTVDIVIGTHRLLQRDIRFKDLGLVIIDEEQRFGVAHKERLRQMRQQVDTLTLSATPIPRTLHMSLSGIRDMSTMETPPELRLPIKTYVTESDDRIIREAMMRELERGGQVFFVHNRVQSIERVAAHLRDLVPEAEISIGHGQQPEELLERTMVDFVEGRSDVLVCTTIIESGLDIPNVNTIIIDKADKLGLAQLYQLRGRVGRGAARAYAYLVFDRYHALTETAQKRLQAIFEATELGAGFQIALRDLEIRGAGNLLGAEQSGHIGTVGFDLYVRLLADAVERLKAIREGEPPPEPKTERPPIAIDLPFTAHLPTAYIGDLNLRLALYQRLAAVETTDAVEDLSQEMRDRFGPPPPAAENLLFAVRVRALARQSDIVSIQQVDSTLIIQTRGVVPPRELLHDMRIKGLTAGPAQARLDLGVIEDGWPDALLEVLHAIGKEQPVTSIA
jgi:transcription-repair coupling factor (superfamily II helicase)